MAVRQYYLPTIAIVGNWGHLKLGYPTGTRQGFRSGLASVNMNRILNFLRDDQGQDLIEYTLLMAFVALASAALFLGAGGSIKGIWTTSNSQLEAASTSASQISQLGRIG